MLASARSRIARPNSRIAVVLLQGIRVPVDQVQRQHPPLDVEVLHHQPVRRRGRCSWRSCAPARRAATGSMRSAGKSTSEYSIASGSRPTRSWYFTRRYFAWTSSPGDLLRRRELVADDLEHPGERGEGEDQHHHPSRSRGVARSASVECFRLEMEIPVEEGLALLLQAHRGVELGLRLPRHELVEEGHELGRHVHVDDEVGAGEAEERRQVARARSRSASTDSPRPTPSGGGRRRTGVCWFPLTRRPTT